jgi:hypothetical protein
MKVFTVAGVNMEDSTGTPMTTAAKRQVASARAATATCP